MREGWVEKTLGDVGKASMCKRIFKDQTSISGDIPFYKIGTFGKTPNAFISKDLYDEYRGKFSFPKKGDVLISASGTIGRRVIYDGEPAYFQDSNIVWIDNDETVVLNNYLYCFYGYCDWLPSKGATIARLYNSNLKQIPILFPKSLPEQKRIVAILDEVFADIAKATENAEKNLQNAHELFESYLNNVFTQKGEGWVEKTLAELTAKIGSGATPKGGADSYKEEGISLIRSLNVHDRIFKPRKLAFIDNDQANKLSNVVIEPNDVLFNITGASVARCCVVPSEVLPARVNQHVSILRPIKNQISAKFLCYLMTSRPYKDILLGIGAAGATRQAITKKQLQELPIKIPVNLKHQERIAAKMDKCIKETQRLEAIYKQKITELAELKQSILQKTFAGELTLDSDNVSKEVVL